MRALVMQSLKHKTSRRRAGHGMQKESPWQSTEKEERLTLISMRDFESKGEKKRTERVLVMH